MRQPCGASNASATARRATSSRSSGLGALNFATTAPARTSVAGLGKSRWTRTKSDAQARTNSHAHSHSDDRPADWDAETYRETSIQSSRGGSCPTYASALIGTNWCIHEGARYRLAERCNPTRPRETTTARPKARSTQSPLPGRSARGASRNRYALRGSLSSCCVQSYQPLLRRQQISLPMRARFLPKRAVNFSPTLAGRYSARTLDCICTTQPACRNVAATATPQASAKSLSWCCGRSSTANRAHHSLLRSWMSARRNGGYDFSMNAKSGRARSARSGEA